MLVINFNISKITSSSARLIDILIDVTVTLLLSEFLLFNEKMLQSIMQDCRHKIYVQNVSVQMASNAAII